MRVGGYGSTLEWALWAVLLHLTLPTTVAILKPVLSDGSCEKGSFHCGVNSSHCFEQRFNCNNETDCPGGEDELDCFDFAADTFHTAIILNKTFYPWEERFKCSVEMYPPQCVCRMLTKMHCKNAFLTSVPQDISSSITALMLANNSIVLGPTDFSRYRNLKIIDLENNSLEALPVGILRGLSNLTRLFLRNNRLYHLDPGSLEGAQSLEQLVLEGNRFTHFDDLLTLLPSLRRLWLSSNLITLKERVVSPYSHHLEELFLEENLIDELTPDSLRGLSGLLALYLRHNRISTIHPESFKDQTLLIDLELNYNRIQHLYKESFMGLDSLRSLNLNGNPLITVADRTLIRLSSLQSLRLRQMELSAEFLQNISTLHYTQEMNEEQDLQHLYFMRFRYCSYFPTVPDCHPKSDGVSSFENLLVRVELRVAMWVVAILTVTGNLIVLAGRLFNRDDNKLLSMFIKNLAVADLLTGIYLFVIGIKDLQYRSEYSKHAFDWMTSWDCTVTGVLAMTSAEVSVMILSFMSVERWVCITWPLRVPKLSHSAARIILVGIWTTGFILSIVPVFYYQTRQGFYGTNGMCFPLHLDDPWVPGWVYSAFVFIGVNQIGVVLILFSYVGMFCSIRLTRAATTLSLGDREFAIRFFFIVVTDCLCWIPIIVLRIMALANFEIPPELYAYVVVVLLPINSALNPFLYTFTTTKFRSQAGRFFRGNGVCHWPMHRESESETTRYSFFRSATCKWSNGRELLNIQQESALPTTVETIVGDLSKGNQSGSATLGNAYHSEADKTEDLTSETKI